jgi:hypothetical protein
VYSPLGKWLSPKAPTLTSIDAEAFMIRVYVPGAFGSEVETSPLGKDSVFSSNGLNLIASG